MKRAAVNDVIGVMTGGLGSNDDYRQVWGTPGLFDSRSSFEEALNRKDTVLYHGAKGGTTYTVQPQSGRVDFRGRPMRNSIMGVLRDGQLPSPKEMNSAVERSFIPAVGENHSSLRTDQFEKELAAVGRVPLDRSRVGLEVWQPGRGSAGKRVMRLPDGTSYTSEIPALKQHPWLLRAMRSAGLTNKTMLGRFGRTVMRHPLAAGGAAATALALPAAAMSLPQSDVPANSQEAAPIAPTAATAKMPSAGSMLPWLAGGGLALGAAGYGLSRLRRRKEDEHVA